MFIKNINDYLTKVLNYTNFEIIIEKLNINTVFESNNKKFAITGKTGNRYTLLNFNERLFNKNNIKIIKKIEKVISKLTEKRILINGKENIEDIKQIFILKNDDEIIVSPSSNDKVKEITLNSNELLNLYHYFIELFNKPIYSFSASKSISLELQNNENKFNELSIFRKIKVLFNLCDFLKCNERKAIDLTLLDLSKNCGILLINKKLSNCQIIYESITGFYRKVVYKID